VTLEQWLAPFIADAAGESAEVLCKGLGPLLTDGNLARDWLGKRLADMAQGGPSLPAGYADAVCQSLVMFDSDRVHLSLAIMSANAWNAQRETKDTPDIVGFADGWTALSFLGAPDMQLQRYILGKEGANLHAFREPPESPGSGELIYMDNACEALRFVHLGADAVMVRLLVRDPDAEQAIECDARTGEVLRVRQAQSRHGRTQMTLSLLRSLERTEAVPIFERDIATWPAHLRWHGVREALALDSASGFRLLEVVADSDADESVRSLARRTRDDLLARYPQLSA
jgi:hypothetical protein